MHVPGDGQIVLDSSRELLEVVDEQDRVIGLQRRGVIHAKGLLHRSAQVLVFNSLGQLFVQKRSAGKDEFPGLWDCSAAGHVNPDIFIFHPFPTTPQTGSRRERWLPSRGPCGPT